MVSTPNLNHTPHTRSVYQSSSSSSSTTLSSRSSIQPPSFPAVPPISKFSPAYPGPRPGPGFRLLCILTTFTCGHKTSEFSWTRSDPTDSLKLGNQHGVGTPAVSANKPVWKEAEGKCNACCWAAVGVKPDVKEEEEEEEEKEIPLGDEGDSGGGVDAKERKRERKVKVGDWDSAIQDVENTLATAVRGMEIRRAQTLREGRAVEARRKKERRTNSVFEGELWGVGGREDEKQKKTTAAKNGDRVRKETDGQRTQERKKIVVDGRLREVGGRGEERKMTKEGDRERREKVGKRREVEDVVMTPRPSREEERRNSDVRDMVSRGKISGAWNLLRGD